LIEPSFTSSQPCKSSQWDSDWIKWSFIDWKRRLSVKDSRYAGCCWGSDEISKWKKITEIANKILDHRQSRRSDCYRAETGAAAFKKRQERQIVSLTEK